MIAILPLLLGVILLWAAAVKLFSRRGAVAARDTALTSLVGESLAPLAYRTLGGAEAVVGAALLVPVVWAPPAVAATLLTAGFCGYLGYARIAAPQSSCGCMGAKGAPISWRAFTRSGAMFVASLAIPAADVAWTAAVARQPAVSLTVFV
ncbi:MAG: MauE/DoxX family redox-associated membrane protein, partial [Stackebrandtia sp.]